MRTGLYFVEEVFWDALPRICLELEAAVAEHYPGLVPPARWLTLASWIGGDRDGNPSVVTPVTAETLRLHRGSPSSSIAGRSTSSAGASA